MMAPLCRLTAVLVDDDDNDIILVRHALDRLQILDRVIVQPDSERVIPYLRGEGPYRDRQTYPFPGVLILDRRMPRLSGLDLLFWLRTQPRFHTLPVVALSG